MEFSLFSGTFWTWTSFCFDFIKTALYWLTHSNWFIRSRRRWLHLCAFPVCRWSTWATTRIPGQYSWRLWTQSWRPAEPHYPSSIKTVSLDQQRPRAALVTSARWKNSSLQGWRVCALHIFHYRNSMTVTAFTGAGLSNVLFAVFKHILYLFKIAARLHKKHILSLLTGFPLLHNYLLVY